MSDFHDLMKPYRDDVKRQYHAKNMGYYIWPFVYPFVGQVDHIRLSNVIKVIKQTPANTLGQSGALQMPAKFPLKKVLYKLVRERAGLVDDILHNAVDHPLLPKMTGVDEKMQWAEFMFHSFNLKLSLGYGDELAQCFHKCLNWATERIVQVSSPAAELVLNNDIMGSHRAGAVTASGSGNMVEEVENSEAEAHGLVGDDTMEVDEDEDEDEEDEEEEPEAVEDDKKLWPVASPPSLRRDFRRCLCWSDIHNYLVTIETEVQYSEAQLTTAPTEMNLYDRLWEEAELYVNQHERTAEGQDLHRRLEPYVECRISFMRHRRIRFLTREQEGSEAWAKRVVDRVLREQAEADEAEERAEAAREAEERAEAARDAERAAARNRALARRLAAQAREQERRTLVREGRERRLAEGQVLMQLKEELRDLDSVGAALRREDRDLVSEQESHIGSPTRRVEIGVRREEISIALWFNNERQLAKTAEIETHRANVALGYVRERRDINRLTPRSRLLKRGRS